jgi:hypothetical protein
LSPGKNISKSIAMNIEPTVLASAVVMNAEVVVAQPVAGDEARGRFVDLNGRAGEGGGEEAGLQAFLSGIPVADADELTTEVGQVVGIMHKPITGRVGGRALLETSTHCNKTNQLGAKKPEIGPQTIGCTNF